MKTLFDTGPDLKATAVVPWFGSNRMLAPIVGREMRGCRWVGVPFAGGMSELAHIKASTIVVSDLHRHVINLAMCVQCPQRRSQLVEQLDAAPFHPDMLSQAQLHCRAIEDEARQGRQRVPSGEIDWAFHYFISAWMGRSCKSGIDDEFNGGIASRWNANGGGSNRRYRSAIESLEAWGQIMRFCDFRCEDVFDFLDQCQNIIGNGLYCDAPFPGPGDRYKHRFTKAQHRLLADRLGKLNNMRIVCRFYDHPLVRELYPESRWTWRYLTGRDQSNNPNKPEVLIINGESYTAA